MLAARPLLLAILLASMLGAHAAELVMETFALKHRTIEEIIPVLRPLIPPPGVVTGLNDRLVVKTTPDNLSAVAEVLGRIDQPPRRLVISVRQERAETLDALGASLDARVRAGDLTLSTGKAGRGEGSRAGVQVYGTESRDEGVTVQQVQTIEGHPALIRAGTSVPVGERYVFVGPAGVGVADSVRYLDLATGFYALPRVSGDRVTLDLSPHSARLGSAGGGVVDAQSAQAVVSGRLGEWLAVASSAEADTGRSGGIVYSTRKRGEMNRLILLKVEELP
jgi:hypothetical protein